MKRRIDQGELASDLASLPELDRNELLEKWSEIFGTEAPDRIRNNFLIRAIAYRMQEKAMGGLKPSTNRYLEKILQGAADGQKLSAPAVSIKAGTRLLREWHGVMHEVLVLEEGVMFNGKQYKSLSEVARQITGAKWSGPLFFGLKKKVAT